MGTASGQGGAVIVIPARLDSRRLAGKLLLRETGRPLLAHTIERATLAVRQSGGALKETIVACDDPRLAEVARQCGVRVVMTAPDHRCGTTRVAEAVGQLPELSSAELVVNLQADEPEIAPEAIISAVDVLRDDEGAVMATLATPMSAGTEARKADANVVKVVMDCRGRALYFSRAAIPFDRNPASLDEPVWYRHLGIYAYRTNFLSQFGQLPSATLAEREDLEQLTVLYAGHTIAVGIVPADWAGCKIDTPDDYASFVARLRT